MGAKLAKNAIDIGIVVRDREATLHFYRDLVGFEYEQEIAFADAPITMHRLHCGDTVVKLVALTETPEAANPPGGAFGGTGLRYWTVHVENLEELVEELRAAGVKIVLEITSPRPGIRVAMVEDPEGNWLEFLQPD